jgi:hypothetical protein
MSHTSARVFKQYKRVIGYKNSREKGKRVGVRRVDGKESELWGVMREHLVAASIENGRDPLGVACQCGKKCEGNRGNLGRGLTQHP